MIDTIIFLIFAVMTIPLAIRAVSSRNIIHSAVYLMVFMFILSALFIFLGASLVGAIELLVFIGAVVTLLIFTIMLTGGKELE